MVARRRRAARRRARPGRRPRHRHRRAPRGPRRPRPAPQARRPALRPARHRQDAHRALPALCDAGHDGGAAERRLAPLHPRRRQGRPRAPAGDRRPRGLRPRRRGPVVRADGASPLLFEVLDALDGLDADADVAFLLTTNRVEDLEAPCRSGPAASTSPPRSRCPTSEGGASCSGSTAATSSAPRRSRPRPRGAEGTTASFAKELVRRAVLLAAASGADRRTTPGPPSTSCCPTRGADPEPARVGSGSGPGSRNPGMQPDRPLLRIGRLLMADRAADFLALHVPGTPLLLPNPWDAGSARLLAALGFEALATTSGGFAGHPRPAPTATSPATRRSRHAAAIVGAVDVPVSADLENGFADDPAGVAETVRLAVAAGLAGCSVEDWDPDRAPICMRRELAAERVAAAAEAAHGGEPSRSCSRPGRRTTSTARDPEDLDDTIRPAAGVPGSRRRRALRARGEQRRRASGGSSSRCRARSTCWPSPTRPPVPPARRARGRARLHRFGPVLGGDGRAGRRGGGAARPRHVCVLVRRRPRSGRRGGGLSRRRSGPGAAHDITHLTLPPGQGRQWSMWQRGSRF